MPAQIHPTRKTGWEDLSEPGLRAFFRIAELWDLSDGDQMRLLAVKAQPIFHEWKEDPRTVLSKDMLERISHVLGIYKALQILLPDEKAADEWIKRPNEASLFGGRSALDRMLSGRVSDLSSVRKYLDAQRAGGA